MFTTVFFFFTLVILWRFYVKMMMFQPSTSAVSGSCRHAHQKSLRVAISVVVHFMLFFLGQVHTSEIFLLHFYFKRTWFFLFVNWIRFHHMRKFLRYLLFSRSLREGIADLTNRMGRCSQWNWQRNLLRLPKYIVLYNVRFGSACKLPVSFSTGNGKFVEIFKWKVINRYKMMKSYIQSQLQFWKYAINRCFMYFPPAHLCNQVYDDSIDYICISLEDW